MATKPIPVSARHRIVNMPRNKLVRLLEDFCGCQCYDSETDQTLRTALICNLEDRTLCPSDVETVWREK